MKVNKKHIFLLFTIIILVFGFFKFFDKKEESKEENPEKPNFYIETKKIWDFWNTYTLEKTSKIDSNSEISLSSEVYAKLKSLNVKEWDRVSKWEVLASFEDTSWLITISYKQAELNLAQAKNSLASSKISLDKAVFDAELNLEKLENNYKTLKETLKENLKQAKNSLWDANLLDSNSKSSLDLAKLDETIKKLEFDYETVKTSNKENLKSFLNNLEKELSNLKNLTEDTADFWDRLFYVTWKYDVDSSFRSYFWEKDSIQKNQTKIILTELISFRDWDLEDLEIKDIYDIDKYSKVLEKWYELNIDFLQNLEKTVNNSIPSVWTLSEAEIAAYGANVNSLQLQTQQLNASFVALKNAINNFLNTYKEKEESIKKQIELTKKDREILKLSLESWELNAEIWYNKTKISSDDSLKNMELSIKNAKNLLKIAKENRQVSLNTLKNNIKKAEVSLEKASIDYSKLYIKSPIDWIVSSLKAEVWQTYNSGFQLISLVWDSKSELEVYMQADDLDKIKVWDNVVVNYREKTLTGSVFSKSNLADTNLNYKVIISLPEKIDFFWWIAKVKFSLNSSKNLFPINAILIIWWEDRIWEINVFSGWIIEKKTIKLWKSFWDKIEFETDLNPEVEVILNDVSNFDKDKFEIKIVHSS